MEYPFNVIAAGMVAPDRILSMGQIELIDHLTVYKQMTCLMDPVGCGC